MTGSTTELQRMPKDSAPSAGVVLNHLNRTADYWMEKLEERVSHMELAQAQEFKSVHKQLLREGAYPSVSQALNMLFETLGRGESELIYLSHYHHGIYALLESRSGTHTEYFTDDNGTQSYAPANSVSYKDAMKEVNKRRKRKAK